MGITRSRMDGPSFMQGWRRQSLCVFVVCLLGEDGRQVAAGGTVGCFCVGAAVHVFFRFV